MSEREAHGMASAWSRLLLPDVASETHPSQSQAKQGK